MKTGLVFNLIQELFSRTYALTTGEEPYPLHSLIERDRKRFSPQSVLDIGCGSGRFAMAGCDYVGIDPNPKYIEYCRQHRPGRYEQMSGDSLSFSDSAFDMVLSFSVGHHLPDTALAQTLTEARRVLRDDGVFIFVDVIRPIVGWQWAAALLERLDEGDSFRNEGEYLALIAPRFAIAEREQIVDQFYRTLVLRCRKS